MSMASTAAPPTAVPQPPAAPPPPPEDAAGDGGETIDTFSSYVLPVESLPKCLLRALVESHSDASALPRPPPPASNDEVIDINDNEVIDLVDSDVSNQASEPVLSDTSADLSEAETALLAKLSSHTSPACESALLSSVSAPRPPEQAGETLLELAKSGALSPLQLEGATLAIARHNRLLVESPNKTIRAGFFLGDGAGVGKGRQISAVLRDSLCRGRTRHLWVSVSRELCQDAKRDLQDLGCHLDVHDGSELLNQTAGASSKGLGAGGSLGKGVLFVTYPLLISGKGKRMDEIINWLAGGRSNTKNSTKLNAEATFDGLLIFDECHRAKNMDAGTQTAKLVIELQARLPHARVLYCSATGVSDIKHMVYASRLGLWGAGNPLYPTFQSFQLALTNRGVGSLEMLALEMKQKGVFVARTLAWEGAEFETMQVKLGKRQVASYDAAVQWWYSAKREIETALSVLGMAPPKTLWRAFWSAHQRFFKELCICAKLDQVVEKAQNYLKEGYSVVIGLQSTGEAGTQCALEELEEQMLAEAGQNAVLRRSNSGRIDFEDVVLPSLLSTAQSIMSNFIRNHFPVAPSPVEPPKVPPLPENGFRSEAERVQYLLLQQEAERIRNLPPPEPLPMLVTLKGIVLESIKQLDLPPNPLDDLIDRLGGVNEVAEMTGRSGRIVRTGENQYKFVKRLGVPTKQKYGLSMPISAEDADKVNIVEKRKFMDGRKSIAVISDAASTGISLHAAEGSGAEHKRRVHFTIELPWAADKAIQQLGRSHRSGQRSAPIYQMVVTELGGERRFAAAVSKRMANLGALTKGDRRAATGADLAEFDIDSRFGKRALKRVYMNLRAMPPVAPSRNSNAILDEFVHLAGDETVDVRKQDQNVQRAYSLLAAAESLICVGLTGEADVKVFLNRILGLAVSRQNLVFSLFMSTLEDVVTDAKATGEFEGSVEEVKATSISMKDDAQVIATDKSSGARTLLTTLTLDRGISFEQVIESILGDLPGGDALPEEVESVDFVSNPVVAESGFYLSKRKIAGRNLLMFAKRKIDQDNIGEGISVIDPLGLMIISRPNTGKNPCEMSTRDLRFKYDKIVASRDLIRLLGDGGSETDSGSTSDTSPEAAISIIRKKKPNLAKLWDDAHSESNHSDHHMGLAPRISHLGLVTGAVLHVLPALEKATMFMSASQRALRVMRVELTGSGQRLVGIRFPLEKEAIDRLLKEISEAKVGGGVNETAVSFRDESFSPVDVKSTAWATTERKTMRSFFAAKCTPNSSSGTKRKSITPTPKKTTNKKPSFEATKKNGATPRISSFFAKKS